MSTKTRPPSQAKLSLPRLIFRWSCIGLFALAIFAFSKASSKREVYTIPDYPAITPDYVSYWQPEKVLGLKFMVVE